MYQENFFNELIIDNFAGGGGASIGIELATGRPVDVAVNHDVDAIAMHAVNHPYTKHYQEDVFAINPEKVTNGRPVGIAWFSPDCKHFSRAKGNKPVEHKIRGLSWVVLKWAMSNVSPRCIFMENVEEIQTWGPLITDADGKSRPDPERAGETFKAFVGMLSDGVAPDCPALAEACEFLKIERGSAEELKLAQGLPKDYVIDIESHIGKKYSEAKQIARLGNAVCPPVATALIRANVPELCYKRNLRTVAELERAINYA